MIYKDLIHHTTTTKFSFLQRVKHLCGAPVVIKSEIKCQFIPGAIKAEAKGIHTRIFSRTGKGQYMMSFNSVIMLDLYKTEKVISEEDYQSVKSMLDSPDKENHVVAEELLKVKYAPLWNKKKNSFIYKLKNLFR